MQGKKGENDRKWFKMELMQRTRWMDTGRKGRRVRRVMMKSEKRQIEKAKEEILQWCVCANYGNTLFFKQVEKLILLQ